MISEGHAKFWLGLSALAAGVALGVLGLYQHSRQPSSRQAATTQVASGAAGAARAPAVDSEPALEARPVAQPAAGDPARQALAASLKTWLSDVRDYQQPDRAVFMEASLEKLVEGGAKTVFELERQLAETSLYEQQQRSAAFYVLGRIGKDLTRSTDPEAKQALTAIVRMAKSELELPDLIEPDPDADVYGLTEADQHELVHQGILVERDGELLQPTTMNKLPVIRMLGQIGDDASRAQLEALAKATDNPAGIGFALEEAIARR